MPRQPKRDDGFVAFVQRAFEKRRAELTETVMAGLDDHGRYRDAAGRAAGITEAEQMLLDCWRRYGAEDDDET